MKTYLTTAIYTVYSEHYRAHTECRASFMRKGRYLTAKGCERLIRAGCDEVPDPAPGAVVVRVEHAVFSR